MNIKKIFICFLFIFFICSSPTSAINTFKYPDKELKKGFCSNLLNELNFPNFPYHQEDPFEVFIELEVEDVNEIDGKNLDFESFFTLWTFWIDPRLVEVLKKLEMYEDTNKPAWLCDYEPGTIWGAERRLFDPTIEMFNRKSKPDFQTGLADWIDIFSNGTVETRLRDTAKFKSSSFDFRKFPFDNQTLSFELWSEYPSTIVSLESYDLAMNVHKENLYGFEGDEGIVIPGWNLIGVDYETYEYVEQDGFPYKGFIVELEVKRISNYYLFKIFLPILLILIISWSVFWIHPSQIEAKVNITIVALLSLIAYNLIMDEEIPKLDYLTFMDAFILLSYLFTGGATILCVYSYYRYKKYGRPINLVDYYSKFLGPILYALSLSSCVYIFL